MGSEVRWFEKPLGEITCNHDGKRKPVKESERKKGPYPYYGASGIVDYVDGYLFEGRHLLVAEDGENLRTRQTPIAFMADGRFWVNNHAHIVTGNGEVTTEYLHYFLQNADIQSYLTGAVMPKLTQGNLNRIPVRYPDPDCQKSIVRVLGSLDAKINLNRRINQTLEAMAQAIFKSWFVDFDPVKTKIAAIQDSRDPLRAAMSAISGKPDAELDALPTTQYDALAATAALFPDEMEESALGEIPRRWVFQFAETLAEVGIGKTPPRKEPQWFTEGEGDWRWVSIKDMGASGVFQQRSSEFLTAEAVSRFNVRVVPDRTVLLSFKLTIGRVAISDGPMVTNEAIAHFKLPSDAAISSEYLYLYLKGFDYSTLGSTSSIADAVNSKTIREMPIMVADRDLIARFSKSISPLFEEMRNRQNEIASLGATRVALLPKLLSGEIAVFA
ncbi:MULTISPECIES: restriction endonuclease subunit S [Zoogloea]|jgi:type I restriction enzyme S subunit|uniref:restriction endonuclease subunit S n=1 Tax=Zoogloea TaxID=349 RepID=UPI00258DA381|nr:MULTISPECIES: restriction endonuclease subunit S [Zoogloea]MDD2669854.1 restriction endonuclease subunit S [Zoogloea sp.]MDY0038017.1 restriction endonuclease subunit S [Zoogloea oleivorans]